MIRHLVFFAVAVLLAASALPAQTTSSNGIYQPGANTLFYLPMDSPDAGAPEGCTTNNPGLLTYVTDRLGNPNKAIHVGGTGSASDSFFISCQNTKIAASASTSITVGYWIRITQPIPAGGNCAVSSGVCGYRSLTILSSNGTNGGCDKYLVAEVRFGNTPGAFPSACSSGNGEFASPNSIADGNWHNILWVYDFTNNLLTLYLDGSQNSQAPLAGPPLSAANGQWIGGAENGSFALNGDMDDLWMENHAWTPAEVANYLPPPTVNQTSLDPGPWPTLSHDNQRTNRSGLSGPVSPGIPSLLYDAGSPVSLNYITATSDGKILLSSCTPQIIALDINGKPLGTPWPFALLPTAYPGSPETPWGGVTVSADGHTYVATHECPDISGGVPTHLYSIKADGTSEANWPVSSRAMYYASAIGSDGTIFQMDEYNVVNAYHPDGTLFWSVGLPGYSQGAIALDANNNLYIGTDGPTYGGHTVFSFTSSGSSRAGWPQDANGAVASTTAAVTTDNIIYIATPTTGALYGFNSDGTVRPGFPYGAGGTTSPQPLALSTLGTIYMKTSLGLFAINPDGSSAWGTPFSPGGDPSLSPSPLVDINGAIYVAFGDNVYALNSSGSVLPGWPVTVPSAGYMAIGGDGVLLVASAGQRLYSIRTASTTGGTISVATNLSSSTFAITGPASYSGSGISTTFGNVPAGTYTIAFGAVAGYITPSLPSQSLATGGALVFSGTYNPVSIAPNPVSFPNTYIGGASPVQYVTVTNGSGRTVTMGAVTVSPNFTENSSACVSLATGRSCRIAVKFQPGSVGNLIGTLNINETNPPGSQAVTLSGTGYYRIAVTPNPLPPFPDTSVGATSPSQCASVTNNTTASVAISAVSASANFAIDKNSTTCSASLAANGSCRACAVFKPSLVGSLQGTLSTNTSLGSQKVSLSGNGVSGGISLSASSLSYPDTNVGARSVAQSITLTNLTGGVAIMGSVTASENFLVSGNTCATPVAIGKTCRLSAQFAPIAAGLQAGTITINETSPSGAQTINLSGTGFNLVPTISRLDPIRRAAGTAGFVIDVYGAHFVGNSTLRWNGIDRVTTFITTGHLQAQILATDIDHQNTAYVTVYNSPPGGGESGQQPFSIVAPHSQRLMAYTPPISPIPSGAYSKLTHLVHNFLQLNNDGTLAVPATGLLVNPTFIANEKNTGVKVMISIGGGPNQAAAFSNVASDPTATSTFVNSVYDFLSTYGYDGVDIDWEYPIYPKDMNNSTFLMQALRQKLTSGFIISMAVSARPDYYPALDILSITPYVDFYNVETYDAANGTNDAGNNAPLYFDAGSSFAVSTSISLYLGKPYLVPPDKLNIGVPFYGYEYDGVNVLGGYCGPTCAPSAKTYAQVMQLIGAGWTRQFDSVAKVPYLLKTDGSNGVISYDDPQSLNLKVQYTLSTSQLGGVFVWNLSEDDSKYDLLNALSNAYLLYGHQ